MDLFVDFDDLLCGALYSSRLIEIIHGDYDFQNYLQVDSLGLDCFDY